MKMAKMTILILVSLVYMATCKPLDTDSETGLKLVHKHSLKKRFINPMLSSGISSNDFSKMRYKRSEDDCEKLSLCKLHARSSYNFFAAYELYFVNKENARLWDHRPHSVADCEARFGDCYEE